MAAHPDPTELEADELPAWIEEHLQACVSCRVDRRLLRDGSFAPTDGVAASRATFAAALAEAALGVAPDARAADEAIAEVRYQLGERLGGGASGEVLRAWDPVLRRALALKVLRRGGSGARGRFLAEAQCTAQLEHPNIVPVHHVGVSPDGQPFLAMKEIHGVSLAEAVRSGRLPTIESRVDALRRVCDAVAFAHHKGVLHRDLKPENVMVGEFGEVLVVDWGLARPLRRDGPEPVVQADRFDEPADRTREGQIAGTPAYMAPEQARGEVSRLDERTDVYALGGILFFLLVGRRPIEGSDGTTVLEEAKAGRAARPRDVDPSVPRELDAIVRRAMAVEPDDRYPSVRAMREDLDAWAARVPLPHVGSSWSDRVAKFAARNRTAVRGVGATATLAVFVLLGGAWRYASWLDDARIAAEGEARRAAAAELRAVEEAAAARVALADTRIDQGRAVEAGDALGEALRRLTEAGGDTRAVEMEYARLYAAAPPPVATCHPLGEQAIAAVAVSPDGTQAVGVGAEGRVVTWDTAGCAVLRTAELGRPVAVGLGAAAWLDDGPAVVAFVGDEAVHLRPGAGEIARTAVPGLSALTEAALRERRQPASTGLTRAGEAWVTRGGAAWSSFRFGAPVLHDERPLPADIDTLAVLPGTDLLYASLRAPAAGGAGLWSRATGRRARVLNLGEGAVVAAGGGTAYVDEVYSLHAVDLRAGATLWQTSEGMPAGGQQLTLDGRTLVGVQARDVVLHDTRTGRHSGHAVGPTLLSAVAVNEDARVVVATELAGNSAHTMLPSTRGPVPLAVGNDGNTVGPVLSPGGEVMAHGVGEEVTLLDTRTGASLRSLPSAGMPAAITFGPDGRHLAVIVKRELQVWDVVTGAATARMALAGTPRNVAWTAADELVVLADRELLVMAMPDLAVRHRWPVSAGGCRSVTPIPGTRRVAAVRPDRVEFVDLDGGEVVSVLEGDEVRYRGAVTPDGAVVAVTRWDGLIDLWDLAAGRVARQLRVAMGPILAMDVSADGTLVAAGDWGGAVYVWDRASGALLFTRSLTTPAVTSVRFTPDGRTLFVGVGSWSLERIELDTRRRWEAAGAAFSGSHEERARAFADVGWWARVVPELDAGRDDPLLRAQAHLALGRREEAAAAARRAPPSVYQALLAGL